MLGSGDSFKGWYNYLEAPLFYIGLLPLLIMPQIFGFISKRNRIIYLVFILIFIFAIIFPFFGSCSFWAFTGDYFRGFSISVAFPVLLFSLMGLNEINSLKNANIINLSITFAGLMLLLYFPYQNISQIIIPELQSNVRNFLIFYFVLVILLRFLKYRTFIQILLVLTVFIELVYLYSYSYRDRLLISKEEMKDKKGFNDYTVEALQYINSKDKGFFRINKEYTSDYATHTSFNDSKAQMFGTMAYNPFNQKFYIRFLEELKIITKGDEAQTRWVEGLSSRPLLLNLVSNKYDLTKDSSSQYFKIGYDSIRKFNDVWVAKNDFSLLVWLIRVL